MEILIKGRHHRSRGQYFSHVKAAIWMARSVYVTDLGA